MILDMMWFGGLAIILLFCFVVAFGAPYLPTLRPRSEDALDLLALKPGQTMLEVGCGDGRVLRAAARRGIRTIGYELNPLLVLCAKIVTWKYRHITDVKWANYWRVTWPQADGIYVFLLDRYMSKLNTKIIHEQHGRLRLVSFAFAIPGRRTVQEKNGLFVYEYGKTDQAIHKKIEK